MKLKIATALLSLLMTGPAFAAGSSKAFQQAYNGNVKALQKSLASMDINQRNEKGETVLMNAAGNGQVAALKLILSKKPDLNLLDNEKHSALHYAIENENPEAAVLLVEAGADLVNLNPRKENALILATTVNANSLMAAILKKDKSLVNQTTTDGKTALHEAARFGTAKTVQILLEAGADKSVKNKTGKVALEIAQKAQNEDAIRLLSAGK